jgi:hypothetical protein
MSDTVITKKCPRCNQIKSIYSFYKDRTKIYGARKQCKACVDCYSKTVSGKISRKRWFQSEKGKTTQASYRIKCPEKQPARSAVTNSVAAGRISKVSSYHCRYCWNVAQDYHHHLGYAPEHWFDIQPVCKKCHAKLPKF